MRPVMPLCPLPDPGTPRVRLAPARVMFCGDLQ